MAIDCVPVIAVMAILDRRKKKKPICSRVSAIKAHQKMSRVGPPRDGDCRCHSW